MSTPADAACETCGKPRAVCVCDRCGRLALGRRVVVLQHPQEQDRLLGTVPLLEVALAAERRVGLSWPNLAAVTGGAGGRWGVVWPGQLPRALTAAESALRVVAMDRRGERVDLGFDGILLLDGSWSQAKALWWRNPWLVKLDRVVLSPRAPSIYGRMRKEPRPTFVSTLEAAADVLVACGEPEEVRATLHRAMRTMVQRARDARLPVA